jgi:hypothetical protein
MEGARKNSVQAARKPNSVLGDHSSRPAVADGLQQPTRRFRCGTHPLGASGRCAPAARMEAAGLPAYLVLLRVGFTLRPALLPARCALTAPFHPYLASFQGREAVCFLLHWPYPRLDARAPDVIRHTALRSSDFPPPDEHPCGHHPAAIARPPAQL